MRASWELRTETEAQLNCPICTTEATNQRPGTPYWICPNCACWFQDPPPPKVYHGAHEPAPDAMTAEDKLANACLAEHLFVKVLQEKPSATLDVGAAYPYLAHCLNRFGCTAYAMEPGEAAGKWAAELGVLHWDADFEQAMPGQPFDLVTIVHCFEHLYDPLGALRKLRGLVKDDGYLFLRSPDHDVSGFERDLTPGHYTIHPMFYNYDSFLEALVQTGTFAVKHTYPLVPGQRDYLLRPL
jgi:SAM-dependent methyltransferase